MLFGQDLPLLAQLVIHSTGMFIVCMVCHGELVQAKPGPRHLTSFYLALSLGGVLGGLFVATLSPLIFDGYWEYHSCLFGSLALFSWKAIPAASPKFRPLLKWASAFGLIVLFAGLFFHIQLYQMHAATSSRGFYGVLRVDHFDEDKPQTHRYALRHGQTFHGAQFVEHPSEPTVYYGRNSGLGRALAVLAQDRPLRVGVVGLGVGTVAAYGRPDDTIRFFEINPQVITLAQGEGGYFSFLKDSQAQIQVVDGDARLSLQHEQDQGEASYDLLVLDAFSSDSVPTHLLTREALSLYRARLKAHGVLAFHVTNKHLRLDDQVMRLAADGKLAALLLPSRGKKPLTQNALWVVMSEDESFLKKLAPSRQVQGADDPDPDVPVWTDSYSNLIQLLK